MQTSSLKNQVAIVTGASSGIGKATALKFAAEGAKVGLIDIKKEDAEHVKKKIIKHDGEAMIAEADIRDPEQVEQAIKSIVEHFGKLDIVFANAGINGKVTPIEDITPEEWDQTLETNLKGTFLTTKYAIPYLKKRGGSMVITSSINGTRKFSAIGMSAYSSSKAAQMAFGKMAALELTEYHIRVNIVCPGLIETNIGKNTFKEEENLEKVKIPVEYPEGDQPLEGKGGKPEQVADLVHFLVSDASAHITGTEVYIDGASTLL
ncbi:SDR family oxidoreductase [Amphibacillus cookii]|uniref:SDR family oxidoreductase n=1 Tax=Amphibacillus cookii TaxID=767787 RepID=UPI001959A568|nr:SDR family NAD(P)-dependent oxidoreductase [Amphibacillus cookii]MBM7540217.1 NAD(P)-dependent dehydrogenase (short-subunit alcohol dehydrogenase family) [Amphibacillus cookii]